MVSWPVIVTNYKENGHGQGRSFSTAALTDERG